jgi:hypothetical protein
MVLTCILSFPPMQDQSSMRWPHNFSRPCEKWKCWPLTQNTHPSTKPSERGCCGRVWVHSSDPMVALWDRNRYHLHFPGKEIKVQKGLIAGPKYGEIWGKAWTWPKLHPSRETTRSLGNFAWNGDSLSRPGWVCLCLQKSAKLGDV